MAASASAALLLSNIAIFFFFYLPNNLSASGGFSIDLIHRDSPRSPFYNSSETLSDRASRAIRRSNSRINHFLSALSTDPTTPESKLINDGGIYLMTISLGTPPVQLLAIADTGSDLIWTQCRPCESCYKQDDPLFDPSQSTTYQDLPCQSQPCRDIFEFSSCNTNKICNYSYIYEDQSYINGVLASETFTMNSTANGSVQIPKVAFGCGHNNSGLFTSHIDGLVGLGEGPLSLISQLGSSIDNKFAYCLLPFVQNASSRLDFGDNAVVSGQGAVSTPLFSKEGYETFYFVNLEKISVGDKSISVRSGGYGNTIIDSGSTLTYLPSSVYQDLVSAVKQVIDLPLTQDPSHTLELCYKAGPDSRFPKLKFGFDGGDLVLGSLNTFVQVAENVMCFAFKGSDSGSVFGNVAQQNFKVGFDLENRSIAFLRTDCTKN